MPRGSANLVPHFRPRSKRCAWRASLTYDNFVIRSAHARVLSLCRAVLSLHATPSQNVTLAKDARHTAISALVWRQFARARVVPQHCSVRVLGLRVLLLVLSGILPCACGRVSHDTDSP